MWNERFSSAVGLSLAKELSRRFESFRATESRSIDPPSALFALYPNAKDSPAPIAYSGCFYSSSPQRIQGSFVPGLVVAQLTQDAMRECSVKFLFQFK
jgi:hypothetical protein